MEVRQVRLCRPGVMVVEARCAVQDLLWGGLLVCRRRLLRVSGGVRAVLEVMPVRLHQPGVMIFNARCAVQALLWRAFLCVAAACLG